MIKINGLPADYTGVLADFISVPYESGNNSIYAHLNTMYYHIHGEQFVYPNHADSILLTAGTGVWDLTGSKTEIVPVDTLTTSAFDIHWLSIQNIDGNGEIQIDLYSGLSGSEVLICPVKTHRNAVQSQEGAIAVRVPQQPAGTRISARLSDGTAGALTCSISIQGHYYD